MTRQSHLVKLAPSTYKVHTYHNSRSCLCCSADFATRPCTERQTCRCRRYAALCGHHNTYCPYCWPWKFDIVVWVFFFFFCLELMIRFYLHTRVGNTDRVRNVALTCTDTELLVSFIAKWPWWCWWCVPEWTGERIGQKSLLCCGLLWTGSCTTGWSHIQLVENCVFEMTFISCG